jgi:hypothetical protein
VSRGIGRGCVVIARRLRRARRRIERFPFYPRPLAFRKTCWWLLKELRRDLAALVREGVR